MKDEKPAEAAAPKAAAAPAAEKATVPAATPAPAAAPAAAPAKKKKKTGLIIGIIIAILALAGAGVAAFFLFFNKTAAPEDAVTNTIDAIASGSGISINGTVTANGYTVPVSGKIAKNAAEINASVDFSQISTGTMPLSGSISIKAVLKDEKVYLQISGIKDALGSYASLLGSYLDSYFAFDGQWYVATLDELFAMIPNSNYSSIKQYTKCYTGASMEDAVKELVNIYKDNKFIEATKYEGSEVTKKSSDLYTLKINDEKAAAYKQAIEGNEKVNSIKGCVSSSSSLQSGLTSGNSLTNDYVVSTYSAPAVYAEFGGDKISRIVLDSAQNQAKIDFDITYGNFDIAAPIESTKPLSELINSLSMFMGGSNFTPSYNYQTPSYYDYDYDYDLDDFDLSDYDIDLNDLDLSDYGIDLNDIDLDSLDLDSIDYNELLKALQ